MTDNTQSDVVEALREVERVLMQGSPAITCTVFTTTGTGETLLDHVQSALASLSTKNDKSPRERLAAKVGVAIANRANLGDEPPVSTKDSDGLVGEFEAKWVKWNYGGGSDHDFAWWVAENKDRILTALASSDAVPEEQAAKRIYEHWSFGTWFKGDKPAWVEGGNSEAQVLARTFAHTAIRKGAA